MNKKFVLKKFSAKINLKVNQFTHFFETFSNFSEKNYPRKILFTRSYYNLEKF